MNPPPRRPATQRPPARRKPAKAPPPVARWLPAIAAVSVLAIVVFAGAFGGGDSKQTASADSPPPTAAVDPAAAPVGSDGYGVTGLTVPVSAGPAVVTESTLVPVSKTTLSRNLFQGVFGDDVKAAQNRLTELGFVPGPIDGSFGEQTKEAVWAFEKLIMHVPRADATGKITDAMWQTMQDPIAIQPRRPGSGTHVEIYLPEQVAAVFTNNNAMLVIHISSGSALTPEVTPENSWCETIKIDTDDDGNKLEVPADKDVCGVSYTPGGVFSFQRQVVGDRVGALGRMFNPIYFNYGIAMHGAKNVPLEPASHGCIRMNQTISNTFQSYVHIHDRVYVWGQDGREPESYTKRERTPVFNYDNPNSTTTSSVKTTEKVPPTTVKSTTVTSTPTPTTAAAPSTSTPKTTPPTAPPTTPAPATTQPATTAPPSTAAPTTAEPPRAP